jgi:D-amino peptidase
MEGISQITSFRELWPEYSEYWDTGKEATTADALAAIDGLFAGGATAITVCELHGPPGDAIVDLDRLPERVDWVSAERFLQGPGLAGEHDAVFHLGWHARCGTPDGFMSHTNGLNMRVSIDGRPVTEVHVNAWRTGLPLIGVTGDAALGPQLNGVLEGVPFLAVKQATNRSEASPNFAAEESSTAIRSFALWCAEHASEREPAALPERFVLALSLSPEIADRIDGQHALRRTSPAVLAKSVTDWWYEAEPALTGAMFASFKRLFAADTPPAGRRAILEAWALADEPEWLT